MVSLSKNLIIEAALDLRHPDNGYPDNGAQKNTAGVGSVALRAAERDPIGSLGLIVWFDVMGQ